MHLLLLGSTGRTGTLVLQGALKRGHIVTALVRNPASLDEHTSTQNSNLTVIRGSALNTTDITHAIKVASEDGKGQLVVISTLNPRRVSENPWAAAHPTDSPPRMMADSITNVLAALSDLPNIAGKKPKVVHLSALGVGSSASQAPWALRMMVAHSNVKLTYDDHEAVEAELRKAESVDWVSVRAARLLQGDSQRKEVNVWPEAKGSVGLLAASSMQGVANFLLKAAEGHEWDGQTPIIIN